MQNVLIALAVLGGGYYVIRAFGKATPSQSQGLARKMLGFICIGLAGLLTLRGMLTASVPLFVFGAGLLMPGMQFPWNKKSAGQSSRVATAMLAMELEHDTGRMDGTVLQGSLKGRRISSLQEPEVKALMQECRGVSDQSEALLTAWLDRTRPDWRARWGGGSAGERRANSRTKMTRDEAYAVLGLKPGASTEEIRAAHKRLMKDFHPDKGGSDYLASKINEAKDTLL